MSAERYEIFDDGALTIAIKLGENTQYVDELEDDFVVGAIRQQARDIKLLTQMLHEQRLVIDDLEHRRVKVCDENDQLRTDLAAAVAERDELREALDSIDGTLRSAGAAMGRAIERAEQAEARLAAIEVAPMVARVVEIKRDFASGPYRCLDYDSDKLPGGFVELIARPAKD